MRTKQHTVCHTCRRHKIGCDGLQPECTQCRLTGRVCSGYIQELLVFQHKTPPRKGKQGLTTSTPVNEGTPKPKVEDLPPGSMVRCILPGNLPSSQPTYADSVAFIVQRYIPHYEIPFLSPDSPSRSRICGGWVQALPYVDQKTIEFEHVLLPAARALMLSMSSTNVDGRQHYLDAYGKALRGIRGLLVGKNKAIDPTISLASMCLTLSEVTMPTSNNGWISHLEGVGAMMQSHGPEAFTEGTPHLLFVGFRPLFILGSLIKQKSTFLMEDIWRNIPFSTQRPSPMQVLLGIAASIPSLLENMRRDSTDHDLYHEAFSSALADLQCWEYDFLRSEAKIYWQVPPREIASTIMPQLLPKVLFNFLDVSHANSLSHCWAFRLVCLLQLSDLESQQTGQAQCDDSRTSESQRQKEILNLCTLICEGLPYLLQDEMSLYGPLSAAFPLRMVFSSLEKFDLGKSTHMEWGITIKKVLLAKGVRML